MNKFLISIALAATTLAAPALSFAQTSPLTRADVRAELVQVEAAGYTPGAGDNNNYPADIQAAEAKIADQNSAQTAAQPINDSVGGVSLNGTSASGAPLASMCIGPVSFCNPYFGS